MSYTNNHYNYQIAVVFAILIGGCLFLAMVIAAIYFVCVNNMRDEDKKRLNSGRNSATNWAQQPQPYREDPMTTGSQYNPAPSIQNYDYNPQRTPINQTNAVYTPVPSGNTPYGGGPLVTPTTQQYIQQQQIPQYQPEVIYTQGPQGYIQQQPVEYTIQNPANYVQSSV